MSKQTILSLALSATLLFAGAFVVTANAETLEEFDDVYTLTCTNETETYFIKPSGIIGMVTDLQTGYTCLSAKDTEGKSHMLCKFLGNKDTCVLSEPTEI